ncbi:MAG: hypothetical protein ACXWYN_06420 [Actinomycetota bacterium]
MRRRYMVAAGFALGVLGSIVGVATSASTAPEPRPYGPPIGPRMAKDVGPGELLLVVLGGVYATQEEAVAANEQLLFGDLAGYYMVPVDEYGGFREQVGDAGDYALVSVFRTDQGAAEFAQLAQSVGYPATILPERVQSFGGEYAGLGQEPNPAGTGPLLGPVAESLPTASQP